MPAEEPRVCRELRSQGSPFSQVKCRSKGRRGRRTEAPQVPEHLKPSLPIRAPRPAPDARPAARSPHTMAETAVVQSRHASAGCGGPMRRTREPRPLPTGPRKHLGRGGQCSRPHLEQGCAPGPSLPGLPGPFPAHAVDAASREGPTRQKVGVLSPRPCLPHCGDLGTGQAEASCS